MKVSKKKFEEALEYFRMINELDIQELDLSEFGGPAKIPNEKAMEWRFVGLLNTDYIKLECLEEA